MEVPPGSTAGTVENADAVDVATWLHAMSLQATTNSLPPISVTPLRLTMVAEPAYRQVTCAICRQSLTFDDYYSENGHDGSNGGGEDDEDDDDDGRCSDDNDDGDCHCHRIVVGRCDAMRRHAFHRTCLETWRKRSDTCPLCNKSWEEMK